MDSTQKRRRIAFLPQDEGIAACCSPSRNRRRVTLMYLKLSSLKEDAVRVDSRSSFALGVLDRPPPVCAVRTAAQREGDAGRTQRRKRRLLTSLALRERSLTAEEGNTTQARARSKNGRDTFDLFAQRCLTVAAKRQDG